MNTHTTSSGGAVRRKIHYIDRAIQNRLLFAFIVLEALLVVIGLAYLHADLSALVEENLYRIHFDNAESLFAVLFRKTMLILVALILVNVIVLAIAERFWRRYVESIVSPFSRLVARTGELDLADDVGIESRHEAVDLTLEWRETERARCRRLRQELQHLKADADYGSPAARQEARAALERVKASLP
jgi:hypothetical protein